MRWSCTFVVETRSGRRRRGERERTEESSQDGERDQDEGERNGSMVKNETVAQNGGWNMLDPIADNVDYSLNKQR